MPNHARNRKRSRSCAEPSHLALVSVVAIVSMSATCGTLALGFQSPATTTSLRSSLKPTKSSKSCGSYENMPSITARKSRRSSFLRNQDFSLFMNSNFDDTEATKAEEASTELSVLSERKDAANGIWRIPSLGMLALPFLSGIFPYLLQTAKSLPPNSTEQWTVISLLFVGNRIYLYALSGTIVALAALRGTNDSSLLGQRILDLTEELLYRPSLESKVDMAAESLSSGQSGSFAVEEISEEKPAMIEALRQSGLNTSLDKVTGETQAILLPVLVTLSLATSVVLLPLWTGGGGDMAGENGLNLFNGLLKDQQELLSKIVPKLTEVWNFGLLTMFTRSEIRRLIQEVLPKGLSSGKATAESLDGSGEGEESDVGFNPLVAFEWASSISITVAAFFFHLWPAQNFVNMALAILVARAIQLDRLTVVLGALSLLTIYDATSVFLVPAATAIDTLTNQDPIATLDSASTLASTLTTNLASSSNLMASSNAAGSAMGSVAIQKLTSASFQPGLLVTRIGNDNRLGGTLGLGDAVFPSLLAILTRRFDMNQIEEGTEKGPSLFGAALGGYFLGCFACEFAPLISTSGIPALVFIVPSMVISVFLAATVSGQLGDFLEFAPNADVQSEDS